MTTPELGQEANPHDQKDAIHIAVLPVICPVTSLRPGEHVTIEGMPTGGPGAQEGVGIVDPFLRHRIDRGDRFWILLYPGTVTSLRHEWSHPALTKDDSEDVAWLRQFAEDVGVSYEVLMKGAEHYADDGTSLYMGSNQSYENRYHDYKEFWERFERVAGKTAAEGDGWCFFSCGC